jgi:glutaminase
MPLDARPRSPFHAYLETLLDEIRADDSGEVATYIPELGRADPSWFAIAVCTADGHVHEVGDAAIDFTIQSISKPFVYGLALERHGLDVVLSRVGVEPSGDTFNSIVVDGTNRPFNPMVNAGAIVSTAMIDSEQEVIDVLSRFAGRPLVVDEAVYESERITGDRNRAIGFLMSSFDLMGDDADAAIDRYFRQCSVSVTCRDLAVMAGTWANRGVNPVTGDQALDEASVERVSSVMSSCGMYDASGEWMLRIGLPAKSGVSGGIIAVLPGQFGLAVYSPRLDPRFNSVRGLQVCERISTDFGLHPMRSYADVGGVVRRTTTCARTRSSRLRTIQETSVLDRHGHLATVLELQGELFLATAERVERQIAAAFEDSDVVVLDMRRVTRADGAVIEMLQRLALEVERDGQSLVLADIDGGPGVDSVIEEFEDRILAAFGDGAEVERTDLAAQELLRGLSADELGLVAAACHTVSIAEGETLFKQGDAADSVFFIGSGALSVLLPLDDVDDAGAGSRRLARLGPGLAVGEMSLAGDEARSADVVAAQDAEVAELPVAAFDALVAAHPAIGAAVHVNLARTLATRLRTANEQLRLLSR